MNNKHVGYNFEKFLREDRLAKCEATALRRLGKPLSIGDDEDWRASCQAIVRTAQAMLDRKIGVIQGGRMLCAYRFDVKAENDRDFIFFVGLDSETDHLPIGEFERHWSKAALKNKKEVIANYENSIRKQAFQACRNLITKYKA